MVVESGGGQAGGQQQQRRRGNVLKRADAGRVGSARAPSTLSTPAPPLERLSAGSWQTGEYCQNLPPVPAAPAILRDLVSGQGGVGGWSCGVAAPRAKNRR